MSGEEFAAFIPSPLPPVRPKLALEGTLDERLRAAEQALVRLELAGGMVPSLDWFIYAFVRKEAVVSSKIEGTQATLVDLLTFEAESDEGPRSADVEEVCNYLDALNFARAQLADDYFQRVIPLLWDHYTVYAVDLPGMGWSDIVAGARYEEPELRAAVVEFINGLGLQGVTFAGESLGAALALSASVDLKERVNRVVAFNSYDYPGGVERGNWIARFIIMSVRMPLLGPVVATQEPKPIMRAILRGGYVENPSCRKTSWTSS